VTARRSPTTVPAVLRLDPREGKRRATCKAMGQAAGCRAGGRRAGGVRRGRRGRRGDRSGGAARKGAKRRCGVCGRRCPGFDQGEGGGAGGRWTLAWCAPGWKRTPQGAPGTLGRSTLRRGWRCTAPSRRSGSCCGCLAHGRADRGAGGRRRRAGQGSVRGLTRIGIDEISYKKGHRYLTVVVDHDAGRLLWAAPGHDAATLGRFFDASASSAAPRSGWSVPMPRSGSRPWWPRAARTRCCAWTRSMS